MAALGRTRQRRTNSVARPFAILFAVALLLLLFRSAAAVQAVAVVGTQVLVPVQRVLAETGVTTNRFFQAIGELDKLRTDNADLRAANDPLTLQNPRLPQRGPPCPHGRRRPT